MNKETNRGSFKFLSGLFVVAVLVMLVDRVLDGWLMPAVKAGFKAAVPFIIGVIIAYLLRFAVNPLQNWLVKIFKPKKSSRWCRVLSIILVIVLVFASVVALLWGLIPGLYENISQLVERMPQYLVSIGNWIDELLVKYDIELSQQTSVVLEEKLNELAQNIKDNATNYLSVAGKLLVDIGKGLFNVVIGFMVAFYLLMDTQRFKNLYVRLTKALITDESKYKNISSFIHECDSIMGRYINGKLLESLIVTIICLIGFMIIDVKYILLMSIIVALTNLIPYFGPWIGAVPVVLITLLENPLKAVYVIAFLVVVQVIDNYIVGPKILGDLLKVRPFWILVGVILGGGTFGFLGMILGAPAIALISNLVSRFIAWRDKNKQKENITD